MTFIVGSKSTTGVQKGHSCNLIQVGLTITKVFRQPKERNALTKAICKAAADIGNTAVMSDAGVGALMAYAGVQGAIHNVRINLPHTKDDTFIATMQGQLGTLLSESREICGSIQLQVEDSF